VKGDTGDQGIQGEAGANAPALNLLSEPVMLISLGLGISGILISAMIYRKLGEFE
jgi:hypothetical protein